MQIVTSALYADRWNVLCPTPWAHRHDQSEMLDGPTVAVESAHGAPLVFHAWATMGTKPIPLATGRYEAWARRSARQAFLADGQLFSELWNDRQMLETVRASKGVRLPANALFMALEKIVEDCGGRRIRVFGAGWAKADDRWQLDALAHCRHVGGNNGVEIELAPLKVDARDQWRAMR